MNKCPFLRFRTGIVGILMIIAAGCASTSPTKYYALSTVAGPLTEQKPVSENPIAVGIRLAAIPDYLDRPHIMTRSGENRLMLSDFNKWAGSLKNDISRVLAENLSSLLATDHVYVYPWKQSIPVKYMVDVDITRFDGMLGGNVSLIAQWTISIEDGKELLSWTKSDFSEQVNERSYDALVAAESRLLVKLSRDIADAIRSASQ